MEVNCLSCALKALLSKVYDDSDDCTVLIKCPACKEVLEIHTRRGRFKSVMYRDNSSSGTEA